MHIRNKIIPLLFSVSSLVPARAQNASHTLTQNPIVETVVKDTVKIGNKVSKDISLRTFQFLNGNNMTAVGMGFGKSKSKTTAYATPLAGYDFANKKLWIGGMGFLERGWYNFNENLSLSHELYGELLKEKGLFDSKIAYTFLKLNTKLPKNCSISIDPRLAVHFNRDGIIPKGELLVTGSFPVRKNTSVYIIGQHYDLFGKDLLNFNNIGINGGVVRNF